MTDTEGTQAETPGEQATENLEPAPAQYEASDVGVSEEPSTEAPE